MVFPKASLSAVLGAQGSWISRLFLSWVFPLLRRSVETEQLQVEKMGTFPCRPGGTPLSLDDLNGKKRGKSMKTRIRRIDDWMILDGVALFQETSIWPPFIGVLWGRW